VSVDELTSRFERSRGWVVKQALSAWIAEEEERHRLPLEALEDVDAGHVIDHLAVQSWARSLGTKNHAVLPGGETPLDEQRRRRPGAPSRLPDPPQTGGPPPGSCERSSTRRRGCWSIPGSGSGLEWYAPRDVRRLLVSRHELRYEVRAEMITILWVWHAREDR